MKLFVPFMFLIALFVTACSSDSAETTTPTGIRAATPEAAAGMVVDAMSNLAAKSGSQLEAFTQMFGSSGVRFCPYYRTESTDRILTVEQFIAEFENSEAPLAQWGTHDGSGEPIEMTLREYWQRYVWDVAYHTLSTPHLIENVNDFQGTGNMVNNLLDLYAAPQYRVLEYYQPGQNPELDGMDWTSLILVLHDEGDGVWTIAAIAHGSWTI